jgi:hypothetical protein
MISVSVQKSIRDWRPEAPAAKAAPSSSAAFFMPGPFMAALAGSRKTRRFRSAGARYANPSGLPPRLASRRQFSKLHPRRPLWLLLSPTCLLSPSTGHPQPSSTRPVANTGISAVYWLLSITVNRLTRVGVFEMSKIYILRELTTGEFRGSFSKILNAQRTGSGFSYLIERFEK